MTKGFVGLTVGQRRVQVSFGRFVLDDFTVTNYIENTTDPPPLLSLRATAGERILQDGNIVGVWFEVNGLPDTGNYVLRWVLP